MKQIFYNNGKAYVVLRSIPHHNLVNRDGNVISDLFNGWREHLGADHVLRNNTDFLFCETIPDIEWEEVPLTSSEVS